MTAVRQIIPIRPWMRAPATRAVLGALRAAGGEVRFVGGCVRNAILGHQVNDIDLATTLRPEATRVLDEAVMALQQDPTLRIQIEGHTCNIGTAEYNLALGDRRAGSVRDYLLSRGVAANRLTTVSYGEERPRHDNSREETRRLNRRASLVVNLQK